MRTSSLFLAGLPLLGLLSITTAACTADSGNDDGAGQDEGEKRIKPTDSENLGRIQINWPQGWQVPVNPAQDATAAYRGSNIAIGTASRLKEGDGCVGLSSGLGNGQECGVGITKGKLTSFDLSAIKPTADLSNNGKLAVDFGPKPWLQITRQGAMLQVGGQSDVVVWSDQNRTAINGLLARQNGVIAFGGSYVFSWQLPIIDPIKKTIARGDNQTVDLNPAERRATIHVAAPKRELPNAVATCSTPNRNFIVQRKLANQTNAYSEPDGYSQRSATEGGTPGYNGAEGIVAWRSVPLDKDMDIRVFPFAESEAPMHYEWIVNGVVIPIDAKPGQTSNVSIQRLDVDDVEVEKEDGSTYTVRGTYQVYRQGPNSSWIPITQNTSQYSDCSGYAGRGTWTPPTGTGMDLPDGTYRLVINYNTAEGPKTQDQTITLP